MTCRARDQHGVDQSFVRCGRGQFRGADRESAKMARTSDRRMGRKTVGARAARRTVRRRCLLAGGAVLLAVLCGLVIHQWHPWRYGRVAPPAPNLDGVEPPVARRIRQALDQVERELYSAEAWGRLAAVFDVHDLLPEAVVCYRRAERLNPEDYRWPYFAGICLHTSDQQAARVCFERAADLRPDYAPVHVYLGRSLLFAERTMEAERHFRRAADLEPSCIRALIGLGRVSLTAGDAGAAVVHLSRAVQLGPKNGEVHRVLAEAYRRLGKVDAAKGASEVAAKRGNLEPLTDPVRFDLSWREGVSIRWRKERSEHYKSQGRLDKALEEWVAALRADPKAAEAHLEYGLVLAAVGQADKAIVHYRTAIRIGLKSAFAYNSLGVSLATRGETREAVEALETALRIDPDDPGAANNLGSLLVQLGEIDQGIGLLRKACEALPENASAHYNLAMALTRAGTTEEAVAVFRRVLQIQPGHAPARIELGKALEKLRGRDGAIPP